jgi:hypothetical protein
VVFKELLEMKINRKINESNCLNACSERQHPRQILSKQKAIRTHLPKQSGVFSLP